MLNVCMVFTVLPFLFFTVYYDTISIPVICLFFDLSMSLALTLLV